MLPQLMNNSTTVEDIRKQTRAEKKRLAMAKRKKQLGSLGMTVSMMQMLAWRSSCSVHIQQAAANAVATQPQEESWWDAFFPGATSVSLFQTNEKGQVTVKSSVLKQMEDLKEETGLVCCICREGYRIPASQSAGIYTYTKRATLDDADPSRGSHRATAL